MDATALEKYLLRTDVPLEMRIAELMRFYNLPAGQFLSLGDTLMGVISEEEKDRCAKKIAILNRLMELKGSSDQVQADS